MKDVSGVRQRSGTCSAVKDPDPNVVFKTPQRLAYRWLRDVQIVCRLL
jgi:hypothetical protein